MINAYLKKLKSYDYPLNNDKVVLKNTTDSYNISLLITDFLENKKSLFVVLPSLFLAQKYYDQIINSIDENKVLFYPADELITAEMLMSSGDFKFERINTIINLLDNEPKIVITHFNGAIRYQFNKEKWVNNIYTFKVNDIIKREDMISKLISLGYVNTYTVTKTGEFAHRGSIIDIFPLNSSNPIRIDFFDDEIDTIKYFDNVTQKSFEKIASFKLIPVVEMIFDENELNHAIEKIDSFINEHKLSEEELNKINSDKSDLCNRNNLDILMRYISFFTDDKKTIFEYKEKKRIYLIDIKEIKNTSERMIRDLEEYCSNVNGYSLLDYHYFMDYNSLYNMHNVITSGLDNIDSKAFSINSADVPMYKANRNEILKSLAGYLNHKTVIIPISKEIRLKTLKESLLDNMTYFRIVTSADEIREKEINIIPNTIFPSLELLNDNLIIINETNLFEVKYEVKKVKYKSIYKNATKISRYDELEIGDYVVHYDYGIGRYLGLKTIESDGFKRDYIYVSYAKNDALYIPLEQINLIQKYSSQENKMVHLNELGSSTWAKAKMRVRKKVHDISEQLIKLYANREVAEGFSFSPDSSMQYEFENDFEYELTPDQAKAISDVKKEMESSHPMDRLVCGDVGYGKTEVALRASFKAVLDHKQVAVLAPTTILSRQHYHTFKNRMEKYGVRVELLNRFVSASMQKEILKQVANGNVDVLIGTHRILSEDIKYADLGLLIVDEEQRFGVTHKEKIKEIKVNVDSITLSATPIPRTLQMSIVGIKDLSMIETPPKNRYPIQTYVLERNETIVREAITRELARGGQVFYMYNKVEDIEIVAAKIKELVPDARICIGHGKLPKDKLEKTICDFIDHQYDVIVCTTIIETGLDIPDTNTLIIHDADRLGLSQLYQIRGRVGRSDKIAYAYMMYDKNKKLTPEALARLEAIKELTELGSGFKIAMRDLNIRGAGDILGSEQSGFIESVGLEMYLKILEDELKERKGDLPEPEKKKDLSLSEVYSSRHIDDKYINNEDIKIEIHKKIDLIKSVKQLEDLEEELHDRFGDYDEDLRIYMYEKLFKHLCDAKGIYRIDSKNKLDFIIYMDKDVSYKQDGVYIFDLANDVCKDIKLKYLNHEITISIEKKKYPNHSYLIPLSKFLDKLKNKA